MEERFTLSYTLDPALQARGMKEFRKSAGRMPLWGYGLLLWAFLTMVLRWGLSRNWMRDASTPLQLGVAAAAAGAFVLWILRATLRPASAAPDVSGLIHLGFGPEGMEKKATPVEEKFGWGAFLWFAETEGFYFLYRAETLAELVPKSAFRDGEEEARFRRFLEARVKRAAPKRRQIRPIFYLLLLAAFALLLVGGRSFLGPSWPERSVREFLDLKARGLIGEVRIRRGGELLVKPEGAYVVDGRSYERFRVVLPPELRGDPAYLDGLVGDLPSRSVIDER